MIHTLWKFPNLLHRLSQLLRRVMSLNQAQQLATYDSPVAPVDPEDQVETTGWILKTMKPKHKKVASLIAQGLGPTEIAAIMQITPTYVTMLAKQPKVLAFIKELNEFADLQLHGMFAETVSVIGNVLREGDHADQLKASRLVLEATKRIGPRAVAPIDEGAGTESRLNNLAERLVGLLVKHREGSEAPPIEDAEFTVLGADDVAENSGNA